MSWNLWWDLGLEHVDLIALAWKMGLSRLPALPSPCQSVSRILCFSLMRFHSLGSEVVSKERLGPHVISGSALTYDIAFECTSLSSEYHSNITCSIILKGVA